MNGALEVVQTGQWGHVPVPSTRSGGWRPDLPFRHQDGLKIALQHEPGMTPAGFLQVPFRFQAPPTDRFGRSWRYDWTTTQTVAKGEQPREGGVQLDRLAFEVMFLDQPYDWMVWTGTLDVQRLLRELRAMLREPAPFRLTVGQPALWGPRPLVNMVAAFASIEPEERGGYLGTEYTSVEFIEIPRQRLTREARSRPSEQDRERRHTLRPGESLYDVALAVYHRKSAWDNIARANGMTGVRPDDVGELAAWAKRHGRKTLRVPVLTRAAA